MGKFFLSISNNTFKLYAPEWFMKELQKLKKSDFVSVSYCKEGFRVTFVDFNNSSSFLSYPWSFYIPAKDSSGTIPRPRNKEKIKVGLTFIVSIYGEEDEEFPCEFRRVKYI